ncbi:MAG TPA: glycosyltransferase family 87 protein [Acetobacteraceae bacterium]|nr:glycosyltransferase family 87 protein [Acetobacteraceae bacterium]
MGQITRLQIARIRPYIVFGLLWPLTLVSIWPVIWWLTHLPVIHLPNGRTILAPWQLNDFAMYYTSGHFALSSAPQRVYLPQIMLHWEHQHVPFDHSPDPFIYPPTTLLLTGIFAHLSYWPAYLSWTTSLVGLSAMSLRLAKLPWRVIIAALLSPAAIFTIFLGQLSVVSGSFFVAALLLIDMAPASAGILSALTIFKPQAALLAPLAILARKQWGGVACGIVVALTIFGITAAIFGGATWQFFLDDGLASSRYLMQLPFPQHWAASQKPGGYEYAQISVFFMLRSLGFSFDNAWIGQVLITISAISVTWIIWRRHDVDPMIRVVLTIFLGLLVTPYIFDNDMFVFSLGVILMIWHRRALAMGDVILLIWPGIAVQVSYLLDTSITPLFVIWAAYRAFGMLQPVSQKEQVTAALP